MNDLTELTHAAAHLARPRVFTIVGSGIIGLLTGLSLANRGHRVTIVSSEGRPGGEALHAVKLGNDVTITPRGGRDGLSENRSEAASASASAAAVAQFLPWAPPKYREALHRSVGDLEPVVRVSREYYARLAANANITGVMSLRNIELAGKGDWSKELIAAMGAREVALDHPIYLPGDNHKSECADVEYEFDTFSLNTGKALRYLADQAAARGVQFRKKRLSFSQFGTLPGVVINATGDGAKKLTGNSKVHHHKGHTITLRPHDEYLPKEILSAFDLVVLPRDDGTIRIGGPHFESECALPQPEEAREVLKLVSVFLERASHRAPSVRPDLLEHCDIEYHSAGWRVRYDEGSICLERDADRPNILHANGFLCFGWTVGPAFAERIADAALAMRE